MTKLSDYEIEQQYKEMLDVSYGTVKIAGYEYGTAYALEECDPIAYRVGLSDYEGTQECGGCSNVLSDCECDDE
jgi:hypothetical protein